MITLLYTKVDSDQALIHQVDNDQALIHPGMWGILCGHPLYYTVLSVPDPGSSTFFDPGIKEENKSRSGIGILDKYVVVHFSESLETIFWVKILNFFVSSVLRNRRIRDPGWKN